MEKAMTSPANAPSNSPAPLLPWPKADEFGYAFDELSAKDAALRFHRAMYHAAMQRLRVAIGWLEEIARTDTPSDYPNEYGGYGGSMAKQALEKIGDLPPHPGEG